MKKHILIYGLCGGALILLLKLVEYRFLVVEHSIEIYGGLIAVLFAVLGIWLGLKLTKTKETVVIKEVLLPASLSFTLNETRLRELGITRDAGRKMPVDPRQSYQPWTDCRFASTTKIWQLALR
jgi:hypothetical protein